MLDPDKKVEEAKRKREGHYQSSQVPEHFANEGSEYATNQSEDNNDIATHANFDKIHGIEQPEEKKETRQADSADTSAGPVRSAENPQAAENSGLPGTASQGNIGQASSGAGLGANKTQGTAKLPNTESTED